MQTEKRIPLWLELLLLALILLATAVLRMGWPTITEFKADEARLLKLALEMAEGQAFPLRGISSSVGVPNFPMSVWLYALPLLAQKSIISATLFTGLLNTLAVALAYWFVRRYWGAEAALVTALMWAVSPWAIHHARKIWAQNLLPFFVVGWGFTAALTFVEKRPSFIVLHLLCLAVAAQAHLAGFTLLPATLLFMLLWRKRLDWHWVAVGIGAAALTFVPFALYLGQQARQTGVHTLLPASGGGRGWDGQAFRYAWLLLTGREIHALTGPERFEHFLANVPNLTWVHLIWGGLMLAGLAFLLWQTWQLRRPANRTRDLNLILLAWLATPILIFSLPLLPVELHYLLPLYPVPYMAAGILLAALARRWRAVLTVVLGGTAVAQTAVWLSLLFYVNTNATPGGFGAPLAYQLELVQQVEAMMAEHGAAEVLIAGVGERPLLDEFAAVYDVLLRDTPHRFVDVRQSALFPAHTAVVLLDAAAGPGAAVYTEAAEQTWAVPLRDGEEALYLLAVAGAPTPEHRLEPPTILTNWASFAGWDGPEQMGDGTAVWRIHWHAGEPATDDFHLFNHLLNEQGQRMGQADAAVFGAAQWQPGDYVVSPFAAQWPEETAVLRVGMYRYPSLEPVLVFDEAGNVAGDGVELGE